MNAFFIFLGALAMLLAGLGASAVGGMIQDEIRARLTHIPYGVLRLAALLVPADQRDDLQAEWRAEASAIFEETKDVPFTGLVRAVWYALGLLARGRAVARELDGTAEERRRQLQGLLTRVKRGARVLAGWQGGSGTRRQVIAASTPAGTIAVSGWAALAASAALTAAAVGITTSVLAGPGPARPGASAPRPGWDPRTGNPADLAFSPDGKILGSGNSDGTVQLWDVAMRRIVWQRLTSSAVDWVAFSPNGKILAFSSSDGTVQLLDVATGRPIRQPLTGRIRLGVPACSLALSPDGKILAASSSDGTVRLLDVATGRQVVQLVGRKAEGGRSGSFPAWCGTLDRQP